MSKHKNRNNNRQKPQHNPLSIIPQQQKAQPTPSHITVECKLEDNPKPEKRWSDIALHNKWLIILTIGTIAVGTGVAVIYGLQLRVMSKTLKADQRSWIKPGPIEFEDMQIGRTVTAWFTVSNIGKTPAQEIFAKARIEIVPNGQSPTFDYSVAYTTQKIATLYPGDSSGKLFILLVGSQKIAATQDMLNAITSGQAYMVAYGKITYKTLDEDHWVQFCSWRAVPEGDFSAQKCTDYNRTDDQQH